MGRKRDPGRLALQGFLMLDGVLHDLPRLILSRRDSAFTPPRERQPGTNDISQHLTAWPVSAPLAR